ncbi:MAG: CPBP family intramembrane metalloprotease [Ruminococcus sp.]|nr:CPBP family intramembrane metalloprotease [Ruminococcus sp.]
MMSDTVTKQKRNNRFRKPLIFTLILLPITALASYFTVLMSLSSLDPSAVEEAIKQVGSRESVILVSMIQPVLLALVCGFFGYIFSENLGLMRRFQIEKKPFLITLIASLIGGAVLSLDAWTFARWIPQLSDSYQAAGTFEPITWIASVLYGGIIEEVMLRLFFMSLLALLVWKIFFRKKETVPTGVLIGANIAAAVLFAAEHLPSTMMTFGELTPLMVVRCFLLNGAFGLLFGRLYRKYGIQYAMLAHMLLHIVSRTVWLIAF